MEPSLNGWPLPADRYPEQGAAKQATDRFSNSPPSCVWGPAVMPCETYRLRYEACMTGRCAGVAT
jgi:hypothetical protein